MSKKYSFFSFHDSIFALKKTKINLHDDGINSSYWEEKDILYYKSKDRSIN